MKAWLLVFTTTFYFLVPSIAWGQTEMSPNSQEEVAKNNLCRDFSQTKISRESSKDAPPPVRTLEDINPDPETINVSEEILYKQLGLTPAKDGSYVCLATDPKNNRRKFTLFKVKKFNKVLVVSTFLDGGNFLPEQEKAATDLFLEAIAFYTNIPQEYHSGINNYLQEFYSRIENGRLQPSSDRVYAVDEPSSTVIMFHPLQGEIEGTAISLNIYLL